MWPLPNGRTINPNAVKEGKVKPMSDHKLMHIKLSPRQHRDLRECAEKFGISDAAVVRLLIRNILGGDKPDYEKFVAECQTAAAASGRWNAENELDAGHVESA